LFTPRLRTLLIAGAKPIAGTLLVARATLDTGAKRLLFVAVSF